MLLVFAFPPNLFRLVQRFFVELGSSNVNYSILISIFEIYNERIFDLLSPQTDRVQLQLKENKNGDLKVQNLTEVAVCNYKAALDLVETARRNRQVKATKLNQDSSRFKIDPFSYSPRPLTCVLDPILFVISRSPICPTSQVRRSWMELKSSCRN